MKVLIVIPTTNSGGAENYTLRFIKWHKSGNYDWHLLSPFLTPGALDASFKELGCHVTYHRLGYGSPKYIWWFLKWAREKKFDSIVTLTGTFGGLPIFLARIVGVPIRIGWHRRSTNAFKEGMVNLLYNKLMILLLEANSTVILSNSLQAFRFFHGIDRIDPNQKKYRIIYNGLDFNYFDPNQVERIYPKKNKFIIGHVGRFDPAKNHKFIFKVIQELKKLSLDFTFLFLGEDTQSEAFRNKLKAHQIDQVTECIGNVKDVRPYYKSMDLFFFPSVTEGQPNALLEAILMNIPFIASNIQPLKDLIPNTYINRLIDVTSAVEAAKRIHTELLIDNDDETKELRSWAVKTFDPSTNFGQFKSLLDGE